MSLEKLNWELARIKAVIEKHIYGTYRPDGDFVRGLADLVEEKESVERRIAEYARPTGSRSR